MIRVASKIGDTSSMKILKDNQRVDGDKYFVDTFESWVELDEYLTQWYEPEAENNTDLRKFIELVRKTREKEEKSS